MMCARPFRGGGNEFGCGQCKPCRINRRRVWVARILLESLQHAQALFVTLTFKPECYPKNGSVDRRDIQLFMKKLRRSVEPMPIRYYAVGEYGEVSGRAHYHVLLFSGGLSHRTIEKAWDKGLIHVGVVTEKSAGYTVGYLMKGMTRDDDKRLKGRNPEFCVMSLKPGIGAVVATHIGDELKKKLSLYSRGMMFPPRYVSEVE